MERFLSTFSKPLPNQRDTLFSNRRLSLNRLSNELLVNVLRHLDNKSLADCRLVNRRWDFIIIDRSLMQFKALILRISEAAGFWNAQINTRNKSWKDLHANEIIITRKLASLNAYLSFPSLFHIDQIYFAACDLSVLINLLQKAPTERVTFIDLKHTGKDVIERDMSELWRILMLKPILKTLNMNFIADFPISVLKSHGRGNLQKIANLSIWGVQATLDDLIFLKDEVSIRLSMSTVTSKSDDEVVEFIKSIIANPRECDVRCIEGCIFENIARQLRLPKLIEFGTELLYFGTQDCAIHIRRCSKHSINIKSSTLSPLDPT
ncbi:hypothetical protein QR680_014818 [Steinernema hermaphroditum]|uniref:F-box domain-containing protein n=1 Tax=Steinernema hermaphroditum TaxID=289476 RepID=A0AA39IA63_9BILA|nr:hypothetical protein QR680_014818 [Steinernema hermaphroditum]